MGGPHIEGLDVVFPALVLGLCNWIGMFARHRLDRK